MAEYTKVSIRQAIKDHGHQYLNDPVIDRIIQDAVEELVGEHPWDWRVDFATGPLPLAIPGLGPIRQVYGDNFELRPSTRDGVRSQFGTLQNGGTPQAYWKEQSTVKGYPQSLVPVTVEFYSTYGWTVAGGATRKQAADADSDELGMPPEFQSLVFCLARVGCKSESQDFDQATEIRQNEYEVKLEAQRSTASQVDELRRVRVTEPDQH